MEYSSIYRELDSVTVLDYAILAKGVGEHYRVQFDHNTCLNFVRSLPVSE